MGVVKEIGVTDFVVASTGNIGVALARYLAAGGVTLYAFIPESSSRLHDAEIGIFGQKVFRVKGDYAKAKAMAAETGPLMKGKPKAANPAPIAAKDRALLWAFRRSASQPQNGGATIRSRLGTVIRMPICATVNPCTLKYRLRYGERIPT